jgi:hypothetical protein
VTGIRPIFGRIPRAIFVIGIIDGFWILSGCTVPVQPDFFISLGWIDGSFLLPKPNEIHHIGKRLIIRVSFFYHFENCELGLSSLFSYRIDNGAFPHAWIDPNPNQ